MFPEEFGEHVSAWFAHWVGAGLQAGAFGAGFWDKTRAYGAGLHLALRTSATGSRPLPTVGGGIAQVREIEGMPLHGI